MPMTRHPGVAPMPVWPVVDTLWLVVAVVLAWAGMGWSALSMPVHWAQIFVEPGAPPPRQTLRVLGATAVLACGWCCLQADHPSMAALVWIMLLTSAGVTVSMILARRPGLLHILWPIGPRPRRA